MKKRILKITKNPFFSGSLIMILGTNGANAINYLYHMIMGRILGPSDYGVLASLISLITILAIFPQSFSLAIAKFVSAAKDKGEVRAIYFLFNRKIYYLSLFFLILLFISSSSISIFLNIQNVTLLYLVSIAFFFVIPAAFYRGILQGMLRFGTFVASIFSDTLIKLLLGLGLVILGYKVLGAILGILIASLVGWGLALYFIKDLRNREISKSSKRMDPILKFTIPVFLQFITLTSFFSSDVLLVKHFFDNFSAGIYAAISSLGKIIFFAITPITSVMFPIISMRHAKNQKFLKIFLLSILITLGLSFIVLVGYFVFPTLAISLLFGKAYLSGSTILLPYALFVSILSLSWVIINFNLAIGRTKTVFIPLIGALSQVILIFYLHTTLFEVVLVSLSISLIMLIVLTISTGFLLKK